MNPQAKLFICLYSDANFLAVNIFENLLSKNCIVNVITKNVNDWREKTKQLSIKNKFIITDRKAFDPKNHYDYAIFCGGFINKKDAYLDYKDFVSVSNTANIKKLILFPFEIYDSNYAEKISVSGNSAVLFIGDLLGPRINFESDLLISKSLSEIVWKRKLTLAVGEVFYPIFVADLVKVIIKWLFSFGPYGKEILLLGNQISGDTFWNHNQKLVGRLELKYDTKLPARNIPKGLEIEIIPSNLVFALNETYVWLSNNQPKRPDRLEGKNESKRVVFKNKAKLPKSVKIVSALLLLIFGFPLLTLLTSLLISFVGYKSLLVGKDDAAQNSILLARTFAVVSEKESSILSYVPGIGLIYKEVSFAANLTGQANNFGIHIIPIVRDSTSLFENILGNQVYNPTDQSRKIESNISLLYKDAVSIKKITEDASQSNVILAKKLLSKIDFERFINLISESRILTGNLPQLLGQDQSKTYLVLFENNMELRPTGGFIGSFGLLTFDGGRLSDLTVNDVYSADGQLNGHVEPPAPIKNYLGEANWWLRDSNWDPDFPTSAKRAEWFLDKELGKKVDGVMAIDLFPIKEILRVTGPIFLSDYNLDITSDNLYEKTQNEVQDNFFPGTHKKASFLTALSRSLLGEVIGLKAPQMLNIFKSFYNSLNERHVQIYLHDNAPQEAFAALQWDGGVISPSCGTNCYADLVGTIEANVGMNKSNYFIQRNINLDVSVGTYEIDHKLTLNLKNPANAALGPSGRYKTYVRILTPTDASSISVKSYNF